MRPERLQGRRFTDLALGERDGLPAIRVGSAAPAAFDHDSAALYPDHPAGERTEFLLEPAVGDRPLQAADRVLDAPLQRASVPAHDRHVRRFRAERLVGGRHHAVARRRHIGTRHDRVAELGLAGPTEDDDGGTGMVDAELAFESGARRPLASELQYKRVNAELFPLDVVRLQSVLVAQLHATVHRRLVNDAIGEGLVGIERDLEALAELVGDLRPDALCRDDLRESTQRLDRPLRRREPVHSK